MRVESGRSSVVTNQKWSCDDFIYHRRLPQRGVRPIALFDGKTYIVHIIECTWANICKEEVWCGLLFGSKMSSEWNDPPHTSEDFSQLKSSLPPVLPALQRIILFETKTVSKPSLLFLPYYCCLEYNIIVFPSIVITDWIGFSCCLRVLRISIS